MKKTLSFIAVAVLLVFGMYFLIHGKKTEYVAPEQTPSMFQIEEPSKQSMPAGVKGEFGDGETQAMPSPKVTPPKIITITGNYFYSEDVKSDFVGKICFEPSTATAGVGKRFCFDNADEVFAIIGITKGFSNGNTQCTQTGPATVTVKNYTKLTGDAGGYDSATLTKFTDTGKSSYLACGKY